MEHNNANFSNRFFRTSPKKPIPANLAQLFATGAAIAQAPAAPPDAR
jgi:hypothetical protein